MLMFEPSTSVSRNRHFNHMTNMLLMINCLYRQPYGDIETTIDAINKMSINKISSVFLCGDFNANHLNSHRHKGSNGFAESLLSLGLFPCINRPSRIASHSATLITFLLTVLNLN